MNITYRNYTDRDIDDIVAFWNTSSGWETTMDRAEFSLRFQSSPAGDSIMMLAIDEEAAELVGLFCFIPVMISVKKNEVKGYRPFGAIIKENFRKQFGLASFITRRHPMIQLYNGGAETAAQNGAALMYILPDPRWGRILKLASFLIHKFPLWSHRLPLETDMEADTKIRVEIIDSADSKIDQLWASSASADQCTLIRNSAFYQWRIAINHGAFSLHGVYAEEKLIGLFTLYYSVQDAQWLIGDIVAMDHEQSSLVQILKAALHAGQNEYKKKVHEPGKNYKIALLATPLLEEKLKPLGFYKDDYDFTLAVHLLNQKKFSKADVDPRHWYVSAKD